MADELIDIITPDNVVTGTAMKSVAHVQGLLHRTILAEIINSKGQWLLVRQAGDRQDAGQYVSPIGGHIRAGESEIEALKREGLEEVGYRDISNVKHIKNAIWNREVLGRKENHYFVLYEIYTDEEPKLGEESVEYRWFTVDELRSGMKFHPEQFGAAWHFAVKKFYRSLFPTL